MFSPNCGPHLPGVSGSPGAAAAPGVVTSPGAESLRFRVAAVIIDLDGTLLDTAPDLVAAANAMRTDLGLSELAAEQIVSYVGKGAEVLVHRALTERADGRAAADLFARAHARFLIRYREYNGRSAQPYAGVREGLAAMRDKRLRLACVTNKPRAFTEPLLRATGLAEFFELTVSGDSLPRRKPDPLPMRYVAEQFQLPAAQILAIGDSGNDALAARAAGMPVVAVPYGYNEGRPIGELDVDAIVSGIDHASRLIDRI